MNSSLSQYLELYRSNRKAIDDGSAPLINALRQPAYGFLEGSRLPERRDEGYEKTSIEEMFAPDYGVNISRLNLPVDAAAAFKCDVPNMSTLMGIVANDKFVATSTLIKNLPEGVTVESLSEAARKHPADVERVYGKIAPLGNPGVALNTLLVQDGVFIHIGRGVRLEKPVQIVNIFSSPTPLMAFRRVAILMEEDSSADLLFCDHSHDDGINYLSSQVIEVSIGRGSHLSMLDMEESSAKTSRFSQMYVRQADSSSLTASCATLLNGTTRNEYSIAIEGQHCSTGLYGMAIGSGAQHIDNCSTIVHAAPRSTSNQLFKYVLQQQATGAFEGGIEVTPVAPHTEAYQSNKNILASADARMHTKPQLLIYNDDVKCSHGASTGQLDNEALFYMQTRGIPLPEARTMLMQAFMVDVINMVSLEGVRDRLRHLVEKRFAGTLGTCQSCSSCSNPDNTPDASGHEEGA